MNLIEFNAKVNLPRFLELQGIKDVEAKPHPYVGWLAYHKETGACIGLLIDLFEDVKLAQTAYASLAQNHPEVFDVNVTYNQKADWNFQQAVEDYFIWKNVFILSRKEMRHQVSWTKDTPKKGTFQEYLLDQGYVGYLENGFGALTDDLMHRYPDIHWPDGTRGHKKILIPTWLTPNTIFSIEACKAENPNERLLVYSIDKKLPKGWYGTITSHIVESVADLSAQRGLVWSPYCIPFMHQPIAFDASVKAETFMDVCSSSDTLQYEEHPTETLEARNFEDEIKENLHKLRKGQISQLEATTGMSLMDAWLASRREHTFLGERRFLKRPDGYFEITPKGDKQVTDFTIDIDHFEVKNDEVFVHLEIIRDTNFYTLVAPHYILSKTNFIYKIRDFLLRNGVSAVEINPSYGRIVPDLINAFSPSARVEYKPRTKLKKPSREELVVEGNDPAENSTDHIK